MDARWMMYQAGKDGARLESMDFYLKQVASLPPYLILDVAHLTRRLVCLFGHDIEYILSRTFEAIMDRTTAHIAVSRMAQDLFNGFMETGKWQRPQLFDALITVEQVALDFQQYVQEQNLYVRGRYLTYHYETMTPDGRVALKRVDSFEEFCDASVMAEQIAEESTITKFEASFDYELFEASNSI